MDTTRERRRREWARVRTGAIPRYIQSISQLTRPKKWPEYRSKVSGGKRRGEGLKGGDERRPEEKTSPLLPHKPCVTTWMVVRGHGPKLKFSPPLPHKPCITTWMVVGGYDANPKFCPLLPHKPCVTTWVVVREHGQTPNSPPPCHKPYSYAVYDTPP